MAKLILSALLRGRKANVEAKVGEFPDSRSRLGALAGPS
jgi:hypothetical protein